MLISRTLNRELVRETQIHCRGPRSLHSVFSVCLPQLTRDIGAMRPKNRAGVTLVELNKALNGVGLRCLFCLHFIAIIVLLCACLFRSVRRCEGQDGSRTRYRVFETLASKLAKTVLNSRNNFITFVISPVALPSFFIWNTSISLQDDSFPLTPFLHCQRARFGQTAMQSKEMILESSLPCPGDYKRYDSVRKSSYITQHQPK
jgi:hypothetical protein